MDLDREELLEAFERATSEFKFCPNRVWSIGGEELPNLLPNSKSMPCSLSRRQGQEGYGEQNNHELCTFDFCEYSQRDFTAIQQRHECKEASCMLLRGRFPREILNEAASHGKSTVWKLAGDTMLEAPLPYMAVSHVWSDGTGAGAWRDGAVNKCLYNFFRGIAEQFQCEGIWWDTICIPRDKATRSKAIQSIQSNYQDARITLVHDCFLRNWEWNPETACFAILMSPWFSRGWTALELAKSRKVKVIFKGRCGLVIKDLDEEILAKENDPNSPRKEASRIIRNLRKKLTSLNDLLTALSPRHTSWPKDLATISALLVGVVPDELQQNTYKNILQKIGRLSPGHLFHNAATMSAGFSWCPTSLFKMPLDMSSDATLIVYEDGIKGRWRLKQVEATLEKNCLWNSSHPLMRRLLQNALKYPEKCWLLAKCGTRPVTDALLARKIQETRYQYLGALYFREELAARNIDDWIEKEVTISSIPDTKDVMSEYPCDEENENGEYTIHSKIYSFEEDEHQKLSEAEVLRRAVWRGDHMVVSTLGRKAELHVPDQLGRWPLHLAAERGDRPMVEFLLEKGDIKAKCPDGQTPLHRACWGGSTATVELLLYQNCETTAEDKDKNTALHIAAQMGFEPVVELLINKNTSVNARGCNDLTPLHNAAMNGHKEVAQLLLKRGAKVNAEDNKIGFTPLHCAAAIGDRELVELLITSGADVNKIDREVGWTPLQLAAMYGHKKVLHLLLKNRANCGEDIYGWTPRQFAEINGHSDAAELLSTKDSVAFITKSRWTPLHCISIDSRKELFKFLVASDAGVNFHRQDEGWLPLHFAAKNGLMAPIKWMLQENADLDTNDGSGHTPLSGAAAMGHEAIVDLLLEKGANIKARGAKGLTPISQAARDGHAGVVELLLEKGAKANGRTHDLLKPLSWAAMMGHPDIAELLLDKGAQLEGKDGTYQSASESDDEEEDDEENFPPGKPLVQTEKMNDWRMTPLSWAARMGHKAVVQLLLQRGARIEGSDIGETPLSWAAQMGHVGIVELLLQKGAKFDRDWHGKHTSLFWAVMNRKKDVVELLLEKGAVVDGIRRERLHRIGGEPESDDSSTYNDSSWTPLSCASLRGYEDIVALLLQKGADIEAQDKHGLTPISFATIEGHKTVVELLLQEGANIEAKDESGRTPLIWAAEEGHKAIITLLLQKGANIEAQDAHGWTPLAYATEKGHEAIVTLLLQEGAYPETQNNRGRRRRHVLLRKGMRRLLQSYFRKGRG